MNYILFCCTRRGEYSCLAPTVNNAHVDIHWNRMSAPPNPPHPRNPEPTLPSLNPKPLTPKPTQISALPAVSWINYAFSGHHTHRCGVGNILASLVPFAKLISSSDLFWTCPRVRITRNGTAFDGLAARPTAERKGPASSFAKPQA